MGRIMPRVWCFALSVLLISLTLLTMTATETTELTFEAAQVDSKLQEVAQGLKGLPSNLKENLASLGVAKFRRDVEPPTEFEVEDDGSNSDLKDLIQKNAIQQQELTKKLARAEASIQTIKKEGKKSDEHRSSHPTNAKRALSAINKKVALLGHPKDVKKQDSGTPTTVRKGTPKPLRKEDSRPSSVINQKTTLLGTPKSVTDEYDNIITQGVTESNGKLDSQGLLNMNAKGMEAVGSGSSSSTGSGSNAKKSHSGAGRLTSQALFAALGLLLHLI